MPQDRNITSRRLYHLGLALFTMFIIAMQSASIAHAAQYGDVHHEHNGIVCAVDAIATDQDVVIPVPAAAFSPVAIVAPVYKTGFVSASFVTPTGRAPPPRSPPTLS